ncbi:MAG: hypothetical protein ACRCYQ_07325 [Nocardioides sp.]
MRRTGCLLGVVALSLAAAGIYAAIRLGADLPAGLRAERCTATVGETTVRLETEQAENSALIAAISIERGMPARAASIALATAYQESKLYNIDFGDRDSIGLFQQRPSQGWGERRQLLNRRYAINAFYDALERVEGYQKMPITRAAQLVQRSAYPDAYADHAADGRALASALTGETRPGAFTCIARHSAAADEGDEEATSLDAAGLTARAAAVRRDLGRAFGRDLPLGGFAPGGVTSGHMPGSAHYEGRAIDVTVRPVNAESNRRGWAIASYLVANANRLEIQTVIFDDRIWTAGNSSVRGWRDYRPPDGVSGDDVVIEHRDHVHVDVV